MKTPIRTALAAGVFLMAVMVIPESRAASPKAGAAPAAKEKPAPEGKIEGIAIARPNGNWLGLSIKGQCFRLGFYDAHKMPMAPDCIRAVARWHSRNKLYQDLSVLLPATDGVSLAGNRYVQPPRIFRVFLTLIGPGDKVLETYAVDFHE